MLTTERNYTTRGPRLDHSFKLFSVPHCLEDSESTCGSTSAISMTIAMLDKQRSIIETAAPGTLMLQVIRITADDAYCWYMSFSALKWCVEVADVAEA